MVADDIRPEESGPLEGRAQRRAGLACPSEKVASFFASRRFPKLPRQRVVHDGARVVDHRQETPAASTTL